MDELTLHQMLQEQTGKGIPIVNEIKQLGDTRFTIEMELINEDEHKGLTIG